MKAEKKTQYGSFNEEDRTDNIILFSLHANTLFPFHINPLEIPAGVSVSEYISTLHSVFLGAFTWPMPSPIILQKALEIAYEKKIFLEIMLSKKMMMFNFLLFLTFMMLLKKP